MTCNIADLVALRGRDDPLGVITKLNGSTAHVLWWTTSEKPQYKSYCSVDDLIIVQPAQVKRGRPKKKK